MRFLFYTHSLVSDWNHGNAHFLRGVMRELQVLGHTTLALEPADGWSRANLIADRGHGAVERFKSDFPSLRTQTYGPDFDHEEAVSQADVVIVHEWTAPDLVARLGQWRIQGGGFRLFFHDTHHRAVSATEEIGNLNLDGYDCVLVFGETLRQLYLHAGWGDQVVTWHEAADTSLFHPHAEIARRSDLVWIGNWGDGEREAELETYLISPAADLRLEATIHGVRYPANALQRLADAGIHYGGSIANADVPEAFAHHRMTVHVPRRPYVEALSGIPTIRMFEALACGIPLVSAPWEDAEGLFRAGTDFLFVRSGNEMKRAMRSLLNDRDLADEFARNGLDTIRSRHTCRHRANELLQHVGRRTTANSRLEELPA